ncbi:MAG: hypothetical protein EOP04_13535 [Proteobacteria bacterium]|nr:MAG: hypothetical protein EOP04_13535 [Pseudomonadota bacterium]
MKKNLTSIAILSSLLAIQFGCGKKKSSGGSDTGVGGVYDPSIEAGKSVGSFKLSKISISDAKSLLITGSGASLSLTADGTVLKPNTLYKITADGLTKEVTYSDEEGNIVSSDTVFPTHVSSPSSTVIVFEFYDSTYVVNKSTEKAYVLSKNDKPLIMNQIKKSKLSTDEKTTFYGNGSIDNQISLYKVSFDGENITAQPISVANTTTSRYWETSTGDVLYESQTGAQTLRKADGTFKAIVSGNTWVSYTGEILSNEGSFPNMNVKNVLSGQIKYNLAKFSFHTAPALNTQVENFGMGLDCWSSTGNMSCSNPSAITAMNMADFPSFLATALPTASAYYWPGLPGLSVKIADTAIPNAASSFQNGSTFWTSQNFFCYFSDGFIQSEWVEGIIARDESTAVIPCDRKLAYYQEENGHFGFQELDYLPGTAFQQNGDFLYIIGKDRALYKVNIKTKVSTPLTVTDVFEVTGFQVGSSGTLTIQGSLVDGTSFVGSLDENNILTLISKVGTGQTITVKPLN